MAKYKPYTTQQGIFAAVFLEDQLQPGTFEYTLNHLINQELDLDFFDGRYRNDETGAPAYDPRILLKIILFAYSRGITSSRRIERCCKGNMVFMAFKNKVNTRWNLFTIVHNMKKIHRYGTVFG